MTKKTTTKCFGCGGNFKNLKVHLARNKDCSRDEQIHQLIERDFAAFKSSEPDFLFKLRTLLCEKGIATYEVEQYTYEVGKYKACWAPRFWSTLVNQMIYYEVDQKDILKLVHRYFDESDYKRAIDIVTTSPGCTPRQISSILLVNLKETLHDDGLHLIDWMKGTAVICCMPEREGTKVFEPIPGIHRFEVPPEEYTPETEVEVRLNSKLPACYRRAILQGST